MFDWHSFHLRAGLSIFVGFLLFIHSIWFHWSYSRQSKRVVIAKQNGAACWVLWLLYLLLFTSLLSPSLSIYFGPVVTFSGFMLALSGFFLTCSSRHALGKYWSYRLEIIEDHAWNSDGAYHFLGHPIYLGELLVALGGFVLSGHISVLFFAIAVWHINQRRANAEELVLTAHLGPRPFKPLVWKFICQFKLRPYRIVQQIK